MKQLFSPICKRVKVNFRLHSPEFDQVDPFLNLVLIMFPFLIFPLSPLFRRGLQSHLGKKNPKKQNPRKGSWDTFWCLL